MRKFTLILTAALSLFTFSSCESVKSLLTSQVSRDTLRQASLAQELAELEKLNPREQEVADKLEGKSNRLDAWANGILTPNDYLRAYAALKKFRGGKTVVEVEPKSSDPEDSVINP